MNHEENERTKKRLGMANIDVEENRTQVQSIQQELQRIKQEYKETEKLLQQTKDLHQQTALVRNKFKAECDQYKLELSSLEKNLETAEQDLLQTKDLLQKATQEKNIIRAELEQSQLQYSITSMSLEGSPGGNRFSEAAQTRPRDARPRSDGSVSSATSRYLSESALSREFSVLLVKVSVKLTSGHCVLLATYFDLPRSKLDRIRKDSDTPGITLLDVMKERSIINMYDVSNLQQALADIDLHDINQTLVKPYQEKIDPLMYERHKVGQQDKK
ncbi:hypothetical protein HOLleu_26429 [Holothuria leucospilota]|uniref:Uncharacterized protein n=1 Tax=Holothuria leucospilota TaxID=206669 RepID=A0A9Q1H2U1_HOLLE|nr:hypothetical protein HOLleu_26429 [Holothuria leucospilota]